MSLRTKYSEKEIRNLSKEQYMREATYHDMVMSYGVSFRVAYLARESTKHVDQIKALKIQIQILEEFIDSKTHFILPDDNKFIEEGKSGLSKEYREKFQFMIEAAARKKFDILVVDAVSRLARNVGELFTCIDTLKKYGVGILILKDVSGVKVSDELVDMFIERIIYRGNNEYLWVFNLTGNANGNEQQYRITSYDSDYAESLMNDDNFDIVARFIILLSECKKYCEKKVGRGFKEKFWKPLIIKIAVVAY